MMCGILIFRGILATKAHKIKLIILKDKLKHWYGQDQHQTLLHHAECTLQELQQRLHT